jgi:hypothetical protein
MVLSAASVVNSGRNANAFSSAAANFRVLSRFAKSFDAADAGRLAGAKYVFARSSLRFVDDNKVVFDPAAEQGGEFGVGHQVKPARKNVTLRSPFSPVSDQLYVFEFIGARGRCHPTAI